MEPPRESERKSSRDDGMDAPRKRRARRATDSLSTQPVSPIGKSDRPAARDLLDREIFVSAIAALVMNAKTQAPLTIGIYGPWGSGKSSFLAQLSDRLPKQQLVAMFNPWRLSGGEVWAGLVGEIAPLIDRHLGVWQRLQFILSSDPTRDVGRMHTRVAAASKKIGNWLTVSFGSLGLLASSFLKDLPPRNSGVGNDWTNHALAAGLGWLASHALDHLAWSDVLGYGAWMLVGLVVFFKLVNTFLHPFTTQFKANLAQFAAQDLKNATFKDFEALRRVIGDFTVQRERRGKPYLVLLIDDLDRCSPDHVTSVLEVVNSFIAELPIVTLIAVDTNYVCNAVAAVHQFLFTQNDGTDVRERYGRLFLEKIIHIPFQIPSVGSYERYVEDLLTITDEPSALDLEQEGTGLPRLAEVLAGRKWYQKLALAPLVAYLKFAYSVLQRQQKPQQRWSTSIACRMILGLSLTEEQQNWIRAQDFTTQIWLSAQREYLRGSLFRNFLIIFRLREMQRRAREKILSEAVKIQESDRAILRAHTSDLSGNPRSIKRFVNTYLLAKGIQALSQSSGTPDFTLEDLAAWLVLLQNWPRMGSLVCASVRAQSSSPSSSWTHHLPNGASLEMSNFIDRHRTQLEQLATSARGLDVARCFSFYTTES